MVDGLTPWLLTSTTTGQKKRKTVFVCALWDLWGLVGEISPVNPALATLQGRNQRLSKLLGHRRGLQEHVPIS